MACKPQDRPTFAFTYQTLRYLVTSFVLVGMSAHVLVAGRDYGLLRLRIIYYDSAWPRTVNTKGAGGQGGREKLPQQPKTRGHLELPKKVWPANLRTDHTVGRKKGTF